ncbi:MliC family protein [Deinococcus apachensis]|uniref:MliC family protein n=1 Tax=Deinococcus apachensis TaxID=309886 RepID=UPI00037B3BFA|nr:MliC family protein [Deinococcus apachensis]
MKALRLTAGLTVLALLPVGTPARAQGLPSVPVPGTDVSYLCGGGVALDVSYRSRSIAQLTFGGVTYTLARRNFGPPQYGGVIRYSDPVTSWNIGSGGAFLNQNGQTLASGCQPTDGSGGSSTIIPVGPGDGTSTIIPGPGFAPSFPSVPGFGPFGPTPPPSPPAVNTVNYTCDGGRRVAVAYLGSSTAQLFWQGGTDTLYQTESGSGVRYTNGFYTWVTQGNQGFLQQKGLNQPQITVANNCVALGQ